MDPFYEYNQCQKHTKIELKDQTKVLKKFQDIEIKKFFTKQKLEPEVEVNIKDEVQRLVETKFLQAMDEIHNIDDIIDSKEVKTFEAYTRRNNHMSQRPHIPNYNISLRRIPQDYFESMPDLSNQSTALKRITPTI